MKLLLLVGSVLLAACATPIEQQTPQNISSAVEVKDTAFDKDITYIGPAISKSYAHDYVRYLLRAWKNKKTGNTSYQLYVDIRSIAPLISYGSGDWRSYESASFANGSTVNALLIDDDVRCGTYSCTYDETVGIPVKESFLHSKAGTGFTVRLNSHSGHETFLRVSRNYIQGFMEAIGST